MARKAPWAIKVSFLLLWGSALLLAACRGEIQTPTILYLSPTAPPTPLPTTPTPHPPSPTPLPLAARVNGEPITLAEYQSELARFRAAPGVAGTELAESGEQRVLDDLIAQVLLAQAAASAGHRLDDAALQQRVDQLAANLGGKQALDAWVASHGYTQTDFYTALQRAAAAAWMRDQIIAAVPKTAEQIHARQILLYNSEQANQVLAQLQAGTDFATLAAKYDPLTRGDLGWFPQGILTLPDLEKAIFALQQGQISQVIQTSLGYHIVQVIERVAERPLDPNARLILQEKALRDWLEQRRSQSEIQIFVP